MTAVEFAELTARVNQHVAPIADIDAWVDAVLIGEPRGACTTLPPAHLLADSGDKRALCGSVDYPRVLVSFYPAHARSGLAACPDCATAAGIHTLPRQLSIFESEAS